MHITYSQLVQEKRSVCVCMCVCVCVCTEREKIIGNFLHEPFVSQQQL